MNIILCGPSGTGKTEVGKTLASAIGWAWKDTDEIIEKEYGAITQLFKDRGEEYFRTLEKQTVKSLEKCEKLVISTGGGLVVDNDNARTLKKTGKIVYLRTKKETLLKRLNGSVDRPLLLGALIGIHHNKTHVTSFKGKICTQYAVLFNGVLDL